MARLTNTEKYAIQGMLHNKKTIEEISKQIDRPINVVQKYVDGELNKIHETIAKNKIKDNQSDDDIENVKKSDAGETVIRRGSKDLFITKTAGKKKGIAINTQAASMRSDESKKIVSRYANKNIYRISDGEILEQGDSTK